MLFFDLSFRSDRRPRVDPGPRPGPRAIGFRGCFPPDTYRAERAFHVTTTEWQPHTPGKPGDGYRDEIRSRDNRALCRGARNRRYLRETVFDSPY